MTLYETIFTRRSVRSYDMTPLDEVELASLREFLDATKPLPGQSARFEIVNADKIKKAVAPHYILAYCATSDCAYANVGYVLQNADLYLQNKGYGCCWQGMAKPNEQDEDYCILLAFGKTAVPQRNSIGDFKRLPVSDISNADNTIAQAARLAPSAMNSQPWKLNFSGNKVTIGYLGRGVSRLILGKKMNKIDVGIITRHICLALGNEGKTVTNVSPVGSGKEFAVEITY